MNQNKDATVLKVHFLLLSQNTADREIYKAKVFNLAHDSEGWELHENGTGIQWEPYAMLHCGGKVKKQGSECKGKRGRNTRGQPVLVRTCSHSNWLPQ